MKILSNIEINTISGAKICICKFNSKYTANKTVEISLACEKFCCTKEDSDGKSPRGNEYFVSRENVAGFIRTNCPRKLKLFLHNLCLCCPFYRKGVYPE